MSSKSKAARMDRAKKTDKEGLLKFEHQYRKNDVYKSILVQEQPGCWSLVLSLAAKVLFSTNFVTEALGVPMNALVDKDLREILQLDDIPVFEHAMQRLVLTGCDVECVLRFRHTVTGTYRFVELRAAPYYRDVTAGIQPIACIVASGRLHPSLALNVYQSLMDAKLEREQLTRALEQPLESAAPLPLNVGWNPLGTAMDSAPEEASSISSTWVGPERSQPPAPTPTHPSEPRRKKRKPGVCVKCGTQDTPEWRKGPDGTKNFCNACGLRYAKEVGDSERVATVAASGSSQ
ncbi:hypothetical protein BKA62DRAFT_724202 [Auriculariales sp. MPI-PUGE-AT-0066]|nr:hypothetical protein BKA62DRAFT_724202 [Auriculariales sp. MPI-PUGE-AT-0066]